VSGSAAIHPPARHALQYQPTVPGVHREPENPVIEGAGTHRRVIACRAFVPTGVVRCRGPAGLVLDLDASADHVVLAVFVKCDPEVS
jgi:hypothetical protein